MISYAQNAEDVLLARVFQEKKRGYYVDIGAAHPWVDSVTCHFYLQGWHGLNVEPRPGMAKLLREWRPHDSLAQCVVSSTTGDATFFEVNAVDVKAGDGGGLSTLDAGLAEKYEKDGYEVIRHPMPQYTLASLLEAYNVKDIDFLKIDVEGFEAPVIMNGDWQRWRPVVVVIESITPLEHHDASAAWRPFLEQQDYVMAAFDGVNSYYIRGEDRALCERLRFPVNVLDNVKLWQTRIYEKHLKAKYGRKWRVATATDRNVPRGLKTQLNPSGLLQRIFFR